MGTSWIRSHNTVRRSTNPRLRYEHLQSNSNADLVFDSFWEALSGICTRQINFSDSQINRLCISPDKKYLAAAGHHSVKLYHVKQLSTANPSQTQSAAADANPILTFEGHTNNITGVGFHIDTKWMVTSSEDGTVKIWDTKSGTVQRNYHHGSPVNDVVIHPNQGELISCDREGNVRIWDLGENKCSHQLIPEENVSVASVSVASDGSLLCAGNNTVSLLPSSMLPQTQSTYKKKDQPAENANTKNKGNVYVWRMLQTHDTTSLVPVCKFTAHATYITRVLLSPDVKHLATCSADHTTRIWAVESGPSDPSAQPFAQGQGMSPSAHSSRPTTSTSASTSTSTAMSPNGATNASHASLSTLSPKPARNAMHPPNNLNLDPHSSPLPREPNAFPLEATLMGHQRWVWDCAFSADSAYLVTACSDHYARLWELASQSVIRQYNGHHRGAVCVALNDYSEGR